MFLREAKLTSDIHRCYRLRQKKWNEQDTGDEDHRKHDEDDLDAQDELEEIWCDQQGDELEKYWEEMEQTLLDYLRRHITIIKFIYFPQIKNKFKKGRQRLEMQKR